MLKLGGWGIVLTMFMSIWIMMASDPHERLNRACKPVEWTGNLFTSLALLTWPSTTERVRSTFERTDYGCEFMLWRAFYEKEYVEMMRAKGLIDENGNPIQEFPLNEEGQPSEPTPRPVDLGASNDPAPSDAPIPEGGIAPEPR